MFRSHVSEQLLTQYRQDLLIEQAVDVTRPGIRQQAGGSECVIQALVNMRGQAVMTMQALAHLGDPAFIPPMMSVGASPWLTTELGDLLVRLQARRRRLMAMRRESNERMNGIQHSNPLLSVDVDVRTVANVIADWTGVPLSSLMKDEQTELLTLENEISKRVVGQDVALNAIAQRLRAAKTGLTSENGPQGVFLLVGPSGVGKTETALALADVLYGGEKSLITINLSEYQEPHTVSQLKGSPPGYVGYGQGGILTEAVRKRPYSVVLLDEVEKAHRDVMNLFYQVFDRGFMRDGEGREIDFRNTVILMTSNLGSDHIMQLLDEQPEASEGDLQELLRPILRDHFQPALLARFQTVIYRPLAESAMRTIVEMKLPAPLPLSITHQTGDRTGQPGRVFLAGQTQGQRMAQDREFPAFMAGQFLHNDTLSFPATRPLAVLTVIEVATAGAQQRQRDNHVNSFTAGGNRQITDRRKRVSQVGIHEGTVLKAYHQTGGVQA